VGVFETGKPSRRAIALSHFLRVSSQETPAIFAENFRVPRMPFRDFRISRGDHVSSPVLDGYTTTTTELQIPRGKGKSPATTETGPIKQDRSGAREASRLLFQI
jgi:hypothetical protein